MTPERERKLAADRAAAQAAFAAADQALGRARAREVAAQAAQTWVARSADIARIDQRLAACADGPDLPEGTAAQVAELLATLDQTVARIAEAEARIAQCDQIIAENPEDPQAGDLARELAGLEDSRIDGASLTSRADTARSDLVRRIEEREAKARQMDGVLAELGLPQAKVGDLLLPPEDLEALASAVQTCLSAEQECKAARTALHSGEAQRGAAPARPQDMTHLQGAWETWQAVSDLSLATANLQAAQARLDKAVVGLPQDWVGLLGDGLPLRETLEDFARDWAALNADLRAAEEVLAERAAECAMAKSQREAEEAAPMAVDAAQIEASRRNRDAAWAAHRASLSAESADAFEARMYADDGARANFLAGAEARQQLAAARRTEMAALASHRMARDRLESLRERHRTQTAPCGRVCHGSGVGARLRPGGVCWAAGRFARGRRVGCRSEKRRERLGTGTQTARGGAVGAALCGARRCNRRGR